MQRQRFKRREIKSFDYSIQIFFVENISLLFVNLKYKGKTKKGSIINQRSAQKKEVLLSRLVSKLDCLLCNFIF